MKKFAPLFIAAAGLASLQGCASETNTASEMTLEDQAAVCANPEGTNAAIAALATAITQELHRWNIAAIPQKNNPYVPGVPADFYVYTGYNNQRMLGLTSAGLAACGGSCPMTQNILAMQDSRMDQKVVFNGVKLSSWSFASRLTSGFDKQVTCNNGGWCPYVRDHVFGWNPTTSNYTGFTAVAGACDTLFTFNAHKLSGGVYSALSAAETSGLKNALVWTAANGDNPYIAFQSTASTVSVDPGGQLNPPGQTTGSDICQKFSTTSLNGQVCTCAANNIYSNGQLRNDQQLTPNTYYCRQM